MKSGQLPHLLVIAYACAPGRGSEWGVGWSFVQEMSKTQPVWVITHEDNRADIEPHLKLHSTPHPIHVRYARLPWYISWLRNTNYTLLNVHYYFWQFVAAGAARQLHDQVRFDLVQHVSYQRWWMHTAGAALSKFGVKFIFGPVVGGDLMPRNFKGDIPLWARWSEFQRWLAVSLWRLDPMLRRCVRRADLVLAGTRNAYDSLGKLGATRIVMVPCTQLSAPPILAAAQAERDALPANRPFRIVSAGGMSYYRGIDLALRAFARAEIPNSQYVHACDGLYRPRLEALVKELGLEGRVIFTGDAPHSTNVKVVATADIYVHTVLRDSSGLIVEAEALGIPVVTMDHNSMGLLVDETVGHKIAIGKDATPEGVIKELTYLFKKWYADPELRQQLGKAGKTHALQFNADSLAATFRKHQRELLTLSSPGRSRRTGEQKLLEDLG